LENKQNIILNNTIEKAKKGSSKAMHLIYKQYAKAMYSTCIRMSNSKEDAEDILQESFTNAFQNLNSYAYQASFGTWLKRIVVNNCINASNKKKN